MRNHISKVLLISIATLISLFIVSTSQANSVKERMAARIPAINSLMDKGVIGENNQGFLEYRSGARPQQELVNAENQDRSAVYRAIAKNQGASATLVGQRRAQMIFENGKAGRWYQRPDGSWFKK